MLRLSLRTASRDILPFLYTLLELALSPCVSPARRLYERLGFTVVVETETHTYMQHIG